MNDYKKLITQIKGDVAFRHIVSECGDDGKVWFEKRFISHFRRFRRSLILRAYSANFCSACGEYPYDDGEYHLVWHTDYCPHCGAKMEEHFADLGKKVDEVS